MDFGPTRSIYRPTMRKRPLRNIGLMDGRLKGIIKQEACVNQTLSHSAKMFMFGPWR